MGDTAIFYFLELPPLPHHSDGICCICFLFLLHKHKDVMFGLNIFIDEIQKSNTFTVCFIFCCGIYDLPCKETQLR